MSFLSAQPQLLMEAATDLAGIGSSVSAASAAAALPTSSVMAAGADEISAAMATMFGAHAQQYQAMGVQAANLHSQFVQTMNASSGAYADAEAGNAKPLQPVAQAAQNVGNAPVRSLFESLGNGGGAGVGAARVGRPVGLLSGNRGSAGTAAAAPGRLAGNALNAGGNARPIGTGTGGAAGAGGAAPVAKKRAATSSRGGANGLLGPGTAGGSGVLNATGDNGCKTFGAGGAGGTRPMPATSAAPA